MNKPIVRIHDIETNDIIDREMTDAEFAQYEIDLATSEQQQAEQVIKETQRQALLNRLGITAEEAALLLGGN